MRKTTKKGLKAIETKLDKEYQNFFRKLCADFGITSQYSDEPMQVCHHPIEKSRSAILRYYPPNFVPLTHGEHANISLSRGDNTVMNRINLKRGIGWIEMIENLKNKTISKDWKYYSDARIQLEEMKERREELVKNYKEKGYFFL